MVAVRTAADPEVPLAVREFVALALIGQGYCARHHRAARAWVAHLVTDPGARPGHFAVVRELARYVGPPPDVFWNPTAGQVSGGPDHMDGRALARVLLDEGALAAFARLAGATRPPWWLRATAAAPSDP